ncbi:uncharacterized protein LOC129280926 [Lytechinus pictus]|uniref:uncharacterized protein LOC129280926 n=1 Tax=Lytechinus pictus TaxID=7653 RepID=UPI0030B9B696
MYICKLCTYSTDSLKQFSDHFKVHRNVANFDFPCGVPGCCRTFRHYSSFKAHVYRDHQHLSRKHAVQHVHITLYCPLCAVKFTEISDVLSHLKGHISSGVAVPCPFAHCQKQFSVKSSFSSHISRQHSKRQVEFLSESVLREKYKALTESNPAEEDDQEFPDEEILHCTDDVKVDDTEEDVFVTNDVFKENLALFYLKLEAKFLLPSSTIQEIVNSFQEIHSLSNSNLLQELRQRLKALDIPEHELTDLLTVFTTEDLLNPTNCSYFRSDCTRTSYFKSKFNYVHPLEIYLGVDQCGRQRYCQYVPIRETLLALFKQNSFIQNYNKTHRDHPVRKTVLEDVYDGQTFLKGDSSKDDTAVTLILYQDSFEVVNPLGSGRKKHKMLAVYATLADIQPHNRSNIDHMQLVLLCREQDYKEFGASAVFGRLVVIFSC